MTIKYSHFQCRSFGQRIRFRFLQLKAKLVQMINIQSVLYPTEGMRAVKQVETTGTSIKGCMNRDKLKKDNHFALDNIA